MAVRITEIVDEEGSSHSNQDASGMVDTLQRITLKVEGSLYSKDAELLEHICEEASEKTNQPVIVEVSEICFLDRAGAEVLCRMRRERRIKIKGMNLFVKKVVDLSDDTCR